MQQETTLILNAPPSHPLQKEHYLIEGSQVSPAQPTHKETNAEKDEYGGLVEWY
jgi:hypothetical protein